MIISNRTLSALTQCCLAVVVIQSVFSKDTPLSGIKPSCGYLWGEKQISKNCCFSPNKYGKDSDENNILDSKNELTFKELTRALKVDTSHVSYYKFEDRLYNYLRFVEEDTFTFSFHYLKKISNYVKITFLMENLPFKNLNITCGNYMIDSYEVGLILIYSIRLIFKTVDDKAAFLKEYKKLWTLPVALNDLIPSIQIIKNQKLKYTLEIDGIQIGGEEEHLIPKKTVTIMKCQKDDLENCKSKINDLEHYMTHDIDNQVADQEKNEMDLPSLFVPLVDVRLGKNLIYVNEEDYEIENYHILLNLNLFYPFYRYLSRLKEVYPIKNEEIQKLYSEFDKEIKVIKEDPSYNRTHLESLKSTFMERFTLEKYYTIVFEKSYCFSSEYSKIFQWDERKYIKLFFNTLQKTEVTSYYESNFAECEKIRIDEKEKKITMICHEAIFAFEIVIAANKPYSPRVSCNITNLGPSVENWSNLIIAMRRQEFMFPERQM